MIIPAVKRGQGQQLADYLLKEKKNDRAELIEMRGFADTHNLENGLLSIELEAAQTKGNKPFYHAAIRLHAGETLTPEQWLHCVDTLGHRLGLDDQARAVVRHEQHGEPHVHVVWSLVDRERGKMLEIPFNGERRVEVARQLEREYNLRELSPAHQRTTERLSRADYEQARREGRETEAIHDIKASIREAWERSDHGAAFVHALEEAGLTLALGDSARAPLGVVDEQGKFYALARTTGAKAQEVREKLADIERDRLPSVEEARRRQESAQRERTQTEREREATPETRQRPQEARREATRQERHTASPERCATPEPPQEATINQGGSRVAAGFAKTAATMLGGIADFFAGGRPEKEKPRLSLDERIEQSRAAMRAEVERRRSLSDEERQREDEERRKASERDRGRERER
jgi:hypothetical protein